MTVSHRTPAARRLRALDAALGALRARGLRVSAARRLVLEALFAAERPVDRRGDRRGLDGRCRRRPRSVYRNLETLEALGLVRHVHLGHGAGRYALAGAPTRGYVACERCGALRAARRATRSRPSAPPSRDGARLRRRASATSRSSACCPAAPREERAMQRIRAALTPPEWRRARRPRPPSSSACTSPASRCCSASSRRSTRARRGSAFAVGRRPHRLHARPAPRVRRRPHRGDRQHDAQADGRGPAAAQRRLLLLARPLDDRLRARVAARRRRPRRSAARSRTTARRCSRRPG